ncbi:MAG: MlaD family protein [Longimicrobiales bacterium]|nr:MlaD family protein [Longimicrobiales bacterium]
MTAGREFVVGMVILAGITVAVIGSLWLSGSGFGQESVPLDIVVPDIGQLREGNAVKHRGVPIGRVRRFDVEEDVVRIRVLLDADALLPRDPVALIAPESMFGEWQVEIVSRARFPNFDYVAADSVPPGDPGVPAVGGFTIPDISRLTATANEISQNLAILSRRVEEAFSDQTANDLQQAIVNLREISSTLREFTMQQTGTFTEVTDEVRSAANEIRAAATAGRTTLERFDGVMERAALDAIFEDVAIAADNLATITTGVAGSTDEVTSALTRADSIFTRLDRITARVEAGEGLVGQLLSDTLVMGQTSEVLTQLELFLRDLRENPKRYVRLTIF